MNAVTHDVETDESMGIDPIEEIRLRTWARMNYTPSDERSMDWHPVILDEMTQKDLEKSSDTTVASV